MDAALWIYIYILGRIPSNCRSPSPLDFVVWGQVQNTRKKTDHLLCCPCCPPASVHRQKHYSFSGKASGYQQRACDNQRYSEAVMNVAILNGWALTLLYEGCLLVITLQISFMCLQSQKADCAADLESAIKVLLFELMTHIMWGSTPLTILYFDDF